MLCWVSGFCVFEKLLQHVWLMASAMFLDQIRLSKQYWKKQTQDQGWTLILVLEIEIIFLNVWSRNFWLNEKALLLFPPNNLTILKWLVAFIISLLNSFFFFNIVVLKVGSVQLYSWVFTDVLAYLTVHFNWLCSIPTSLSRSINVNISIIYCQWKVQLISVIFVQLLYKFK